jgi:hypothetical protein
MYCQHSHALSPDAGRKRLKLPLSLAPDVTLSGCRQEKRFLFWRLLCQRTAFETPAIQLRFFYRLFYERMIFSAPVNSGVFLRKIPAKTVH